MHAAAGSSQRSVSITALGVAIFLSAMADREAEFDAFVIERLNKLGLDDETFVEYVYGIVKLEEAVSTREDKAEGLEEFLSEATVSLNYLHVIVWFPSLECFSSLGESLIGHRRNKSTRRSPPFLITGTRS